MAKNARAKNFKNLFQKIQMVGSKKLTDAQLARVEEIQKMGLRSQIIKLEGDRETLQSSIYDHLNSTEPNWSSIPLIAKKITEATNAIKALQQVEKDYFNTPVNVTTQPVTVEVVSVSDEDESDED
jgi:hypothetical protein